MKQKWMLKKCFFGLASAALFGGMIAACGSGDISNSTTDDDTQLLLMKGEDGSSGYAGDIEMAVEACKLDASCAQKMNGTVYVSSAAESSSSVAIVEPGSSAVAVSSSSVVTSSASINLSSAAVSVLSSSSAGLNLSSSATVEDNGTVNGTCAPVPATISKGESTKWTFTPGITAQNNALFDWTMTGSTEGTFSATGSNGGTTATATYAASGSYGATLSVDGNTIQCSALQVNGAAITGCTCTADASTVDVASGSATATWTVSGCTTNANITGYSWTDATGTGETATAAFTTKGQTIAPTVEVSNDDNTKETFTCASVKAVDSSAPEYELAAQDTEIELPAGDVTISMKLSETWHNETSGTCTFSCQGSGEISGSVDGISFSGSYYVSTTIPITSTISGYSLSVSLNIPAKCKVGW